MDKFHHPKNPQVQGGNLSTCGINYTLAFRIIHHILFRPWFPILLQTTKLATCITAP